MIRIEDLELTSSNWTSLHDSSMIVSFLVTVNQLFLLIISSDRWITKEFKNCAFDRKDSLGKSITNLEESLEDVRKIERELIKVFQRFRNKPMEVFEESIKMYYVVWMCFEGVPNCRSVLSHPPSSDVTCVCVQLDREEMEQS